MKRIPVILLSLLATTARAEEYTLDRCQELARSNYPNIKQKELIEQSRGYSLANVSTAWLPQVTLSARASYQTQVTVIPINIPGVDIPQQHKDQYQASIQLNQLVWDGGQSASARRTIEASAEVQRHQYEVDAYAVRNRVSELFFAVLLLDAQIELNSVTRSELERYRRDVQSYSDNGVANRSDIDRVEVELAASDQTQIELTTAREAYMRMLTVFTGEPYSPSARLKSPEQEIVTADGDFARRPEMALMDASVDRQKSLLNSVTVKNMPSIGFFLQGSYGRPGLDMFKTGFTPYAIGGVQLTWNFGGLYTKNNERRQIETDIRNIEIQRDVLRFNLRQAAIRQSAEIEQYKKLTEDDDRIVTLRESIRRATEARVEHGAATTSDLMREMNLEQASRIGRAVHKIKGLKALYDLKNTTNL